MTLFPMFAGLGTALAAACGPVKWTVFGHEDTIRAVLDAPDDPPLRADHAKLIREWRVTWVPIESGAPGIAAVRPFGRSVHVLKRAKQLLRSGDYSLAARTIVESGRVLPAYMASVKLAPGEYPVPADMEAFFGAPGTGVGPDGMFTFRAEHATLLKAANWRLDDRQAIEAMFGRQNAWPVPYIDGKRPYGGMTYYQLDMASWLDEPYEIGADGHPLADEDKDARMQALHNEMMAALQVFLTHARPG
jgi:hypothetical protein